MSNRDTNIYHCCIQKTGSLWLRDMFSDPLIRKLSSMKVCRPNKNFLGDHPIQEIIDDPFPVGTIVSPFYVNYQNFLEIPKPQSHKAFFVMRDPRDFLVSWYLSTRYSHKLNPYIIKQREIFQKMDDDEAIFYIINNIFIETNPQFIAMTDWYLNSDQNESVLLVRYEDLIALNKVDVFLKLFNHIGIPITPKQLKNLLEKYSFYRLSGGRTPGEEDILNHYRKGISGDWKNFFKTGHKDAFKNTVGDILLDLGYEENANW